MTGRVTIDVLPDDVLLKIFDCYMDEALFFIEIDAWHTLVHWRCVVFDSPRRLNLRLFLLSKNTCEGDADHLATLAYHYMGTSLSMQ